MALNRGFAEPSREETPPEPMPSTAGAPPGRRPPTAVGTGGEDPSGWWIRGRERRWRGRRGGVAVASRVSWPSLRGVARVSLAIILFAVIATAVLGSADALFGWIVDEALR
jgi:preprotein translocase SecE subunit